jgi:hypothetical protein
VSVEATLIAAGDVQLGDTLRSRDGTELTVTRIDPGFPLREGMMAFVEDTASQWFKMPAMADGQVELVARGKG